MIGLGRVWKSITGHDEAAAPQPVPRSSIARDVRPVRVLAETSASHLDDPYRDTPDDLPPGETRGADRFVPNRTATVLTTAGGRRVAARIINISTTGVALEAELSGVAASEIATVGSRPVLPGRRITRGMVFLFKKPLDPKLCNPDVIL